ncbi:hypothetical protein SLEP1_g47304 [Rubroshorea leprosula]|uniref:Uncharacterized protein n=1 Tax=Rubroshorea leprosula TaxID=152421 RepID=A0AAV5LQ28_9ROSI|nr:hypothetical protein SLEP1_g47304 [Rubroshorea leprosula]
MDSIRGLTELQGNQGREGEEGGVISVEPITMIVPPTLQDVLETMTLESSASSSARDNGGDHPTASSGNSSFEETLAARKGRGIWLSNLRKAPKDLPTGFRFRAALHHEVADCAPSINGLDTSVRGSFGGRPVISPTRADIRPTSRLRASSDAADAQQHKCWLCPNSRGAKWYYLSGREKRQLFKNVRNKVARWKRQFIFVRDTRTERISNDLVARLSEWRVPNAHVNYPQLLPRDTDLKNQLLEYARRENLIDLEALVSSEQLTVFGFVDVANLFTEVYWNASASEPKVLEGARRVTRNKDRRDLTSGCPQRHNNAVHPTAARARRPGLVPTSGLRLRPPVHASVHERRRKVRTRSPSSGAEQAGGLSSCRRLDLRALTQRALSNCTGNSRARLCVDLSVDAQDRRLTIVAVWQAFSYAVALFKTAAAKSRADELANRNNELREELERARAERESGIQEAKEEAAWVEERAKKAEAERDRAQNELSSLRHQVAKADRNLNAAEEALNELKTSHGCSVSIARAQGVEWLVGSATFQDAVAVASTNMTTEIYNEIRGKVLHHHPDFPILELAFFDGEDIDEQGKSLAPLADTTVRLRWDLNEEGIPVWPPSVLEEGEDLARLPSFDGWVEGASVAEQEPSSTPPNSQPAMVPATSPVDAPAPELATRSSPARSAAAATDASMPVDLTDD